MEAPLHLKQGVVEEEEEEVAGVGGCDWFVAAGQMLPQP